MKPTHPLLSFCASILAVTVVVYGCSDDDADVVVSNNPGQDSGADSAKGTDSSPNGKDTSTPTPPQRPAPPALGAQIDRFGRPAINTAVNNTFTASPTREAAQNAYNADNNAAGWVAAYSAEAAKSLAIYDGLDQTCGNQAFADNDAGAARYSTLASVLADDRQWLNTGSTTCTTYLAVELNATGVGPNTDCGGRKLSYDVIDGTYSLVSGTGGIGDGIAAVPAKTNGAAFPYLAAPL